MLVWVIFLIGIPFVVIGAGGAEAKKKNKAGQRKQRGGGLGDGGETVLKMVSFDTAR